MKTNWIIIALCSVAILAATIGIGLTVQAGVSDQPGTERATVLKDPVFPVP